MVIRIDDHDDWLTSCLQDLKVNGETKVRLNLNGLQGRQSHYIYKYTVPKSRHWRMLPHL